MANTAVFLGNNTVSVAASGALGGDGLIGNPLQVEVDGTSVQIDGSNQIATVGGAAGSAPRAWDSSTTYSTGQVVTEWSGLWRAVDASTNSKPDSGNVHWTLISGDFTKVIDLTSNQIAHLNSSPITAFTGVSGEVVQVVGGFSSMARGTIPFLAYGGQLYYAGDEVTNTWALLNSQLLDFDANFGDDMLASSIPTLKTQKALSFASGKDVLLNWGADDLTGGIATATINAAGLGYAPGDTVADDFFAVGTIITVNTVGALGIVTSITVTAPGFGGVSGTGDTTTALTGIGTGLTINTTITPANGTARVWITCKILSLP